MHISRPHTLKIFIQYAWWDTDFPFLVSFWATLLKFVSEYYIRYYALETASFWPYAHLLSCSVTQSCPAVCHPMPGFSVPHHLPEFAQTHVHWVGDAIQPSHPLSSPSSPALNLSQHQSVYQWDSSLRQEAKVLEFQFQHQSFQWIFRVDFL